MERLLGTRRVASLVGPVIVAALALGGCGDDDDPAGRGRRHDDDRGDHHDGARVAGGRRDRRRRHRADPLEDRFSLLVVSEEPVDDPHDGVIGRASVYEGVEGLTSPVTSDRGIGIGATEDDVRAAYADREIEESPHHYVEGLYLDVREPDRDGVLLRFETNEEGRVTAIHGGRENEARYVEGCA